MRAVIQRVRSAEVTVDHETTGRIDRGLLVLLGVDDRDESADVEWISQKTAQLRIFEDGQGVMNQSVIDTRGDILVVSQFTLLASTKKGARPSYLQAARPDKAIPLYEAFIARCQLLTGRAIASGRFGADMQVSLVNDGPVTIILDSRLRE